MRDHAVTALRELNLVVEQLRAPGGCPWDREQSHLSLRPYLLEETYELLEAIEQGGAAATLREELGDVLLQVLMHAAIAAERGEQGFDLGDVADECRTKLVHRHPHVFGDAAVSGAAEVVVNWERLKAEEKRERLSLLEGVPRSLPALAYCQGVQKRPARVGFDQTPTLGDALASVRASLDALEAAAVVAPGAVGAEVVEPAEPGGDWVTAGELGFARRGSAAASAHAGSPGPTEGAEELVGDLLFAVVALSRRLRVNPEDALRRRTSEFAARFRLLEDAVRAEGASLHGLVPGEWERHWEASETGPG